jgi:hypothetical protein
MNTNLVEQKTLLPLTELALRPTPQRRSFIDRHQDLFESLALALILFLAASQSLILYGIHSIPYMIPNSALCIFLTDLASGLRLSIPTSLPTATLLFIASPYVARPERLVATWYLILLCYLVGSTSGALLLLWSKNEARAGRV